MERLFCSVHKNGMMGLRSIVGFLERITRDEIINSEDDSIEDRCEACIQLLYVLLNHRFEGKFNGTAGRSKEWRVYRNSYNVRGSMSVYDSRYYVDTIGLLFKDRLNVTLTEYDFNYIVKVFRGLIDRDIMTYMIKLMLNNLECRIIPYLVEPQIVPFHRIINSSEKLMASFSCGGHLKLNLNKDSVGDFRISEVYSVVEVADVNQVVLSEILSRINQVDLMSDNVKEFEIRGLNFKSLFYIDIKDSIIDEHRFTIKIKLKKSVEEFNALDHFNKFNYIMNEALLDIARYIVREIDKTNN